MESSSEKAMISDRDSVEVDLVVASGKWSVYETQAAEQWLAGYRQGRTDALQPSADDVLRTSLEFSSKRRLQLAQQLIESVSHEESRPISA